MPTKKNQLGQYFTTNILLKEKIYDFVLNDPKLILEPCVGRGDLVLFFLYKKRELKFDMYEIDTSIVPLDKIDVESIIYTDFLEVDITKKYVTIIGNPPYIRTKKGNLYVEFTEKCYNLLENGGELVFIVPSVFFKLTSSYKLLNMMMLNGSFTHIYHPHNEKLFENASIDIIIFRYSKNSSNEKKVFYNDEIMYIINSNGLITFTKENSGNSTTFKDIFDIYVGVVTGKEEIYKNIQYGNIEIMNGKNKIDKYIYIENFPTTNLEINNYMLKNKQTLLDRKIRKFTENNWWEWGAARNMKTIEKNMGKNCIYIYNLTRKNEVSYVDKVQYFGGGLIIMIPKIDIDLKKINDYINSSLFRDSFTYSGRFKIGHRCLSNSILPSL